MSEWTEDPRYTDVLGAYRAAQAQHRYPHRPRGRWGLRPAGWRNGFVMVVGPDGTVYTTTHGQPPHTDEP